MSRLASRRPAKASKSLETPAGEDPQERIVSGARHHFMAHGFRGVTMDDLAKSMGMSKKTLYAHFGSKTALLEAVVEAKFDEVGRDLDSLSADRSGGFVVQLQSLLTCFRAHMEELGPPFVRDIRRDAPMLFERVQERRQRLMNAHFGRVLAEGREAGLIRDDISVEMVVEILLGAVQAIMNPPKLEALDLSPKEGFLGITKVVLEGTLTEKGRRQL